MDLPAKLQIRPGTRTAVLDAPAGVDLGIPDADLAGSASDAQAVIAFAIVADDLERPAVADAVAAARNDDLAWVAYPKAGQLGTDLNRDRLAAALVARGVRPVRQVAIDATWSALRFRAA